MPKSFDKSNKLSRVRSNSSSTRRNSGSFIESSRNLFLDENDSEMFSGVASEAVPSSIASFHHLHNFEDVEVDQPSDYNRNDNNQSQLPENNLRNEITNNAKDSLARNESFLHSISNKLDSDYNNGRSRNNSLDSNSNRPNFKFFTTDEIENAQGVASTLDDPLVDYDTDWNVGPTYLNMGDEYYDEEEVIQEATKEIKKSKDTKSQVEEIETSEHRDFNTLQETEANFRTRLLSDVSANELLSASNNEFKNNEFAMDSNQGFFSDLKISFQRFYIAEEDLVIGIAGYKTSKTKLSFYYFLNFITFGISYLVFRWLPVYRINFYGTKETLGTCDWVVVETEFGELNVIDVKKERFNKSIKLVFNLREETINENESISDSQQITDTCAALISFEYRYLKLIYNPIDDIFTTNTNWVDRNQWSSSSSIRQGLSEYETEDRRNIFGSNSLDLKEKSIVELLVGEILHPFYIFQILSIILWLMDSYYYYAFCIFLISIISVSQSLIETRETMRKLKEISKLNNYPYIRVKRNGFWKEITIEELVPGDLYELSDPNLSSIPCDSILISGDCIINESMLTGESVPVSKLPITDEVLKKNLLNYDSNFITKNQVNGSLSKSYLFSGTKIVRVRRSQISPNDTNSINSNSSLDNEPSLALVIKVGFATTKGLLLRSMLFPKPTSFKFYKDSFKYIGFMSLIAGIGFIYSIQNFIRLKLDTSLIILRALDIITVVVPPALPATLTIGTSFAVNRLKNANIFCISPSKVNIGAKVDTFCFDKTGTLTEDGLDILGAHIVEASSNNGKCIFGDLVKDLNKSVSNLGSDALNSFENFEDTKLTSLSDKNKNKLFKFLCSMCSCHSLRVVDQEYVGDPLDYKMFEFTEWELIEDYFWNEDTSEKITFPMVARPSKRSCISSKYEKNFIGSIKDFEFIPSLRRMSVITKRLDSFNKKFEVYTKGAPEVISELCKSGTLPQNYEELLYRYTHDGYRVIAIASKTLEETKLHVVKSLSREEIESNLEFLGFIIFENRLKPASKPTLRILSEDANIRTIMCTGDNILTAISVGKESGLISSSDTRIFVPKFDDDGQRDDSISGNDSFNIIWEDVNNPETILNPETLIPCNKDGSLTSEQYFDYQLAITGDVFRYILKKEELEESHNHGNRFSEEYIEKILLNTNIFARMSPDEKHELVEQLQKLDYTVGFCGDGANDCGALKAADIGISLSEAEASVAAPFTSTKFDISCVLDVIREGRASLITSFSCFKFMSLYSAIQFITITILYQKGSNLGDFQFLWIDLFLILPIAIFMSWSKPYNKISKKRPSANLVSSKVLIPLLVNIMILITFQVFVWRSVHTKPWYIKPIVGDDDAVQSSDNTVLFLFSNMQYIIIAIILTQGPPYRESSLKNIPFVVDIVVSFLLSGLLMLVNPESWLGDLMQLTYLDKSFKMVIIFTAVLNFAILWLGDKFIFNYINKAYKRLVYGRNKKSKKYYKRLFAEYRIMQLV